MIDLSSGAVLYAKDADRRMPPASMAKMMTTHVAFDLIKRGQLNPNRMCTVRPETWQRWHGPEAGSTMFLSPSEQVSVDNLLHGIVTLSGNDATVVLAECISGNEAAFVAADEPPVAGDGPRPIRTGAIRSAGRTTASPTPPRATSRRSPPRRSATIPQLYQQLLRAAANSPGAARWAATSRSRQDNRNPLLGRVAGADGLKTGHTDEAGYGFTGSAEQRRAADRDGRRRARQLQPADRGIGALHGMGLQRLAVAAAAPPGPADRRGAGAGRRPSRASAWSRRSRSRSPSRPGSASNIRAKIVYNGPVRAPIAQGQHIADLVVETGDGTPPQTMPLVAESEVGEAGFFGRIWYGLKSLFGAA